MPSAALGAQVAQMPRSRSPDSSDEEGSVQSQQDADNWVQCDRCTKWRRVPKRVTDGLEDDVKWYCEYNPNKLFASCKVPQELTNEEIDQEGAEAGLQKNLPKLPAIWQLITGNNYSHRKRKVQDEDDIMVCHCPPPWRGGDGCGPNCLNRMLCIECTEDFCPCEHKCNNQMFTRKQYAKLAVRRAGPKGFGLFAEEPIKAGQFIIEYVGEVLEEEEYLRRKEYYIEIGQRHFYFMNVGNGELIDACRKGNHARFINHSCDPNCETQKWMVRGELAIGLFALKDIGAQEELTFDYNFERYGDKPMRCYCATKKCRKFIGGTQETQADIVALGDAEDVTNDPEPVMVRPEETDAMVQAMLDKEVGVVRRRWDTSLLSRLQQLCKDRGIDWSYDPLAAGATAHLERLAASAGLTAADMSGQSSMSADAAAAAAGARASPASSSAPDSQAGTAGAEQGAESPARGLKGANKKKAAAQAKRAAAAAATAKQKGRGKQAAGKLAPGAKRKQQPASSAPESSVSQDATAKLEAGATTDMQPLKKRFKMQQQAAAAAAGSDVEGDSARRRLAEESEEEASRSSEEESEQAEGSQDEAGPTTSSTANQIARDHAMAEQLAGGTRRRVVKGNTAAAKALQQLQQARSRKPPLGLPPRPVAAASSGGGAAGEEGGGRSTKGPGASSNGAIGRRAVAAGSQGYAAARPVKRRSEVDRRLEALVMKGSGRLKDHNSANVIKVLRMFNLCDVTPRLAEPSRPQRRPAQLQQQHGSDAEGGAAGGAGAAPAASGSGGEGPGAGSDAETERESEARSRARQRARLADISMLLDVVLATAIDRAKQDWVRCGILQQLQQTVAKLPFAQESSAVLVKVTRVLDHLPLTPDDLYAMRSAHGTFADFIRRMASTASDWEVRRRAHQLLKQYPASACSDDTLLTLASVPGPNGKPYLMSLHLLPAIVQRVMAVAGNQGLQSPAMRLQQRRRMMQQQGLDGTHSPPTHSPSRPGPGGIPRAPVPSNLRGPPGPAGAAAGGPPGAPPSHEPQLMLGNRPFGRLAAGYTGEGWGGHGPEGGPDATPGPAASGAAAGPSATPGTAASAGAPREGAWLPPGGGSSGPGPGTPGWAGWQQHPGRLPPPGATPGGPGWHTPAPGGPTGGPHGPLGPTAAAGAPGGFKGSTPGGPWGPEVPPHTPGWTPGGYPPGGSSRGGAAWAGSPFTEGPPGARPGQALPPSRAGSMPYSQGSAQLLPPVTDLLDEEVEAAGPSREAGVGGPPPQQWHGRAGSPPQAAAVAAAVAGAGLQRRVSSSRWVPAAAAAAPAASVPVLDLMDEDEEDMQPRRPPYHQQQQQQQQPDREPGKQPSPDKRFRGPPEDGRGPGAPWAGARLQQPLHSGGSSRWAAPAEGEPSPGSRGPRARFPDNPQQQQQQQPWRSPRQDRSWPLERSPPRRRNSKEWDVEDCCAAGVYAYLLEEVRDWGASSGVADAAAVKQDLGAVAVAAATAVKQEPGVAAAAAIKPEPEAAPAVKEEAPGSPSCRSSRCRCMSPLLVGRLSPVRAGGAGWRGGMGRWRPPRWAPPPVGGLLDIEEWVSFRGDKVSSRTPGISCCELSEFEFVASQHEAAAAGGPPGSRERGREGSRGRPRGPSRSSSRSRSWSRGRSQGRGRSRRRHRSRSSYYSRSRSSRSSYSSSRSRSRRRSRSSSRSSSRSGSSSRSRSRSRSRGGGLSRGPGRHRLRDRDGWDRDRDERDREGDRDDPWARDKGPGGDFDRYRDRVRGDEAGWGGRRFEGPPWGPPGAGPPGGRHWGRGGPPPPEWGPPPGDWRGPGPGPGPGMWGPGPPRGRLPPPGWDGPPGSGGRRGGEWFGGRLPPRGLVPGGPRRGPGELEGGTSGSRWSPEHAPAGLAREREEGLPPSRGGRIGAPGASPHHRVDAGHPLDWPPPSQQQQLLRAVSGSGREREGHADRPGPRPAQQGDWGPGPAFSGDRDRGRPPAGWVPPSPGSRGHSSREGGENGPGRHMQREEPPRDSWQQQEPLRGGRAAAGAPAVGHSPREAAPSSWRGPAAAPVSDLTMDAAGNGHTAIPTLPSSSLQHAPASGPPSSHASPAGHHAVPPQAAASEQQPGANTAALASAAAVGVVVAGGSFQPSAYPVSWEVPDSSFAAFAGEMVRHRLGKYVQPEHPSRISKEEATQLYRKLSREVVERERQAYAARQASGDARPIERSKVEANIKEFVRLSIRRMHEGAR